MTEIRPFTTSEDAEAIFHGYFASMERKFKTFLSHFKDWETYLADINQNRFNKDYYPEKLFRQFQELVTRIYMDKYPFLQRYCKLYPDYFQYSKDNQIITKTLESAKKGKSITYEFINFNPKDLYYPNIKYICCVHSALHSLALLVHSLKTLDFQNHGICFYERPDLTHPGDEEYLRYYCEKLSVPLIIAYRNENATFHLQKNRAPKNGNIGGRWCSRVYKTEPAELLYRKYFYSAESRIQHLYSKRQLLTLMEKQGIVYPKTLKNAKKQTVIDYTLNLLKKGKIQSQLKTTYGPQSEQFQTFIWEKGQWNIDEKSPQAFTYETIREKNKVTDYTLKGTDSINNIIELIGIAKYQSPKRALMNPNVHLKDNVAEREKEFFIYEQYPIFDLNYSDLQELAEPLHLKRNPYEREYYDLFCKDLEQSKEIRYGCLLCPYKAESYCQFLKDNYPDRYYFARFLLLLASASNLLKSNLKTQYWYYPKSKII